MYSPLLTLKPQYCVIALYSRPTECGKRISSSSRRPSAPPVASVVVERACYVLLDAEGVELGEVRDDRVTVRRGGLAVARQRDVTFKPGDKITALQRSVVIERLGEAGGAKVAEFIEPIERLTAITHPVSSPPSPPQPRLELKPQGDAGGGGSAAKAGTAARRRRERAAAATGRTPRAKPAAAER